MTANQYKRIRAKLERSAALAAEAHQLALDTNPKPFQDEHLLAVTSGAAENARRTVLALDTRERQLKAQAQELARQLTGSQHGEGSAAT